MSFFPTGKGGLFDGIFEQGAFQIDPNATPEEIKRKRDKINRMRYGSARYVGEGLGHLATGILAGKQSRGMDKAERTGRESATALFESLLRGGTAPAAASSSGPMTVLGPKPVETGNLEAGDIANDTMAALGKTSSLPTKDAVSAYILEAAEKRGIDPQTALAVAKSEGLDADPREAWQSNYVKNGKRERSYGPYQLYIDGGLGNEFMDSTGLDPRDPANWQAGVDFSLDHAAQNGWGAWYGAKNTGIGNMQGIPGGESRVAGATATGAPAVSTQGTTGGPDMETLYSALSNPWLSEGQRAVVMQMIQRQQQDSDPLRRLQLERAHLENEALRNPAAKPPKTAKAADGYLYYTEGPNAGQRVFPDVERKEDSPLVSINGNDGRMGAVPKGYVAIEDPNSEAGYRMVPIPGGPEDTSDADAAKAGAKATSTNLVMDEISIARELISGESLLSPATGVTGGIASNIDSTRAGALKNRLTTIKANIGFDKLQAMRDASPTGGALGQVSEFENRLLQAVFGSLEQSQRAEDLLYNLNRLEEIYSRIVNEGIPDDEARLLYREVSMGGASGAQDSAPGDGLTPEEKAYLGIE